MGNFYPKKVLDFNNSIHNNDDHNNPLPKRIQNRKRRLRMSNKPNHARLIRELSKPPQNEFHILLSSRNLHGHFSHGYILLNHFLDL